MLAEQRPDGVLICAHYDRIDDLSACELGVVEAIAATLGERMVSSQPLCFLPETADLSHWDGSAYNHPLDLYSDTDTELPPTYKNALTGDWVKSPQQAVLETIRSCERIRTNTTREVTSHTRCHKVIDVTDGWRTYCPNLVEMKRTERLYRADRERYDLWVVDPGEYREAYCYECR